MSDQNGTDGAKPEFDFSEISWKDSKEFSRMQMRLRQASADNNLDGLDMAFAGMENLLARVVTHIPREWLVKSAPEMLDWSQPTAFDYVRGNRMSDLIIAIGKAQSPEVTEKNSPAAS